MRTVRSWFRRLCTSFNRSRHEHEMAEEIESHLQLHTDDNLRRGMSPAEARRAALLKLGGVEATKEICRDRRGFPVVEHFMRDMRYAALNALRNKAFTSAVVLTLALGMGLATLVFSVVHALFLRPLPYADADRLAIVQKAAPSGGDSGLISFSELENLRASGVFEGVAGYNYAPWPGVLSSGDKVELTSMVDVTGDFFAVFGVRPLFGSTLGAGKSNGIVLSHALWRRLFEGRSGIIGGQVRLNGIARTVVGVLPAGFQLFGSERHEVFVPDTAASRHPGAETLACIARLRRGLPLPDAIRELNGSGGTRESGRSDSPRYEAVDLRSHLFGDYRDALLTLSGAALFVLLIACANVSNLLLARITVRVRELRIRLALGASRARVAAQLLTENLFTAVAGCVAGLLLAHQGARLLERLRLGGFQALPEFRIDGSVLAFACLLCLLVSMLCALGPLLRFTVQGRAQLKESAPTVTATRGRAGRLIVVCGLAFSFMLLMGAGLLAASFRRLARVNPGFQAANVMFMEFDDNQLFFGDIVRRQRFYDELARWAQGIPGFAAAGQTDQVPLSDDVWNVAVSVSLAAPPAGSSGRTRVFLRTVDAGFFHALGIPLKKGRLIGAHDARGSRPVAVVNEGSARRMWGGADPLGQRLTLLGVELTVVGVVGDVRESGLRKQPSDEILYVSTGQFMKGNRVLAVRATADPSALVPAVKDLARSLEPGAPVVRVRNMSRIVADSIAAERFSALLMSGLSALALALASMGVYALVAFSVSQRTREFGVRLALGAQRSQILILLLQEEAPLVAAGLGLGALGGWSLTRLLASQLYGVSPSDPIFFGATAVSVAAFATLASYLPARRASHADPVVALRWDG